VPRSRHLGMLESATWRAFWDRSAIRGFVRAGLSENGAMMLRGHSSRCVAVDSPRPETEFTGGVPSFKSFIAHRA